MNDGTTSATAEARIREARALSNRAIALKDIDAMASVWMDGIHVIGSISVALTGIEASRSMYTAQFARRPDTLYVRTPHTVSVLGAWDVAMEEGEWTGSWTDPDGPVAMTGRYMAQWRQVNGSWLVQAELYVPTRCTGGAYCERHPSIS